MVQMHCLIISLVVLVSKCYIAKEYRFDYEFNEQAKGWLKFHVVPATWEEARMQCHAEGAVLASPLSNQMKSALIWFTKQQKHLNLEEGIAIYSGVHATFHKGVYSSIEGVPLLRLAVTWAPGEPDNYENTESCLVMMVNSDGAMADVRCDNVLPYVCYKKDTELTMTECGTTDPEYIMEHKTGSCYKLHSKILVWSDAYMTCEAEGGYLAIINDDIEASVVKNIHATRLSGNFLSAYPNELLIGYRDWSQHHNFMTIHGETLDAAGYQKWLAGQPNNVSRAETEDYGQFCGGVHKDGLLNNLYCNLPFAFLCEMTPDSLRKNSIQ